MAMGLAIKTEHELNRMEAMSEFTQCRMTSEKAASVPGLSRRQVHLSTRHLIKDCLMTQRRQGPLSLSKWRKLGLYLSS